MLARGVAALGRTPRAGRGLSTVAVGVSGGVDSAVAALMLKRQGHDVVGIHVTSWDEADEGGAERCQDAERRDAQRVCEHLGIGFHELRLVSEYWHSVFEPLVSGYASLATPNPDLDCNRHIKFDALMRHALDLGAEALATGHYARLRHQPAGPTLLLAGADASKDQSYFLATVRQEGLRTALFPLGEMRKEAVRALAAEAGLHVYDKRSSTGLCLVGRRKFAHFLRDYLPEQRRGPVVDVETGRVLSGRHEGLALYTRGQRARIGGQKCAWYVVAKDAPSNTLHVCDARDHPALHHADVHVAHARWTAGAPPAALLSAGAMRCEARVRYQTPVTQCALAPAADSCADGAAFDVAFDDAVRAPAVGQVCVFYDGEVCLGGGAIEACGPSVFEAGRGGEGSTAAWIEARDQNHQQRTQARGAIYSDALSDSPPATVRRER